VYGFISIPSGLIFNIIQHPYFQRLRRIRQLGLADLVYPGALHTRFHHALGAMHLMGEALKNLSDKGTVISPAEYEAAQIAILLHDIGHGPYSHVLETSLLSQVKHEAISAIVIGKLNQHFGGKLQLALQMFENKYPRAFFNQLISSQLDIDRLDYINRDSFFTGVTEASIGSERIIKMLAVQNNQLVVEQKGIYSIENFLNARRLMYWQVYLHKTAISAETMLINIIKRAKEILAIGQQIDNMPNLLPFLENNISQEQLQNNPELLERFLQLDDTDILASLKLWQHSPDHTLASLCRMLLERKIFKISLKDEPFGKQEIAQIEQKISKKSKIQPELLHYWVSSGMASNEAYNESTQNIKILTKDGTIQEISEASDLPTIKALSNIVKKYYVCWANELYL
jgi:uncharacterized protein